ncbi:MAG: hypothetical protein M1821_004001 [Bathelium mastoideum]|nr:MAG: hypothetical protein M1821_004001 [Bathelium mastoideum]
MAAVSIPPSPKDLSMMTSRRVPLANVPNATNSPRRAVPALGTKRHRSNAADQRESQYGQPPPAKKQIIEADDVQNWAAGLRSRTNTEQKNAQREDENGIQAVLGHKAVLGGKDTTSSIQRGGDKSQKSNSENLETIRQWQKHYRRVFPSFVFYFESIPEDIRQKASRQTASLGAKEEQFFSKEVTHVVTARSIPSGLHSTSPSKEGKTSSSSEAPRSHLSQPKTINPSLLDRLDPPPEANSYLHQQRSLAKPESHSNRLFQAKLQSLQDAGTKKSQGHNSGILHKAREMGIKIWSLEKFQRIMATMFESETGEKHPHAQVSRSTTLTTETSKASKVADLSRLLKNEKLNGPTDRDRTTVTSDMVQFTGYYIYVHDMEEQTRPVMARDYKKPANKEDGKWPQFRLTGPGRCPFIEDAVHLKRLQLQDKKLHEMKCQEQRNNLVKSKEAPVAPRTRAAAALEAARAQPMLDIQSNRALTEIDSNISSRPSTATTSKPLDPPKLIPSKRCNPDTASPALFGSAQASLRARPRFAGGEPVASGVQPSNVTSAIKSQMISSTAAAPGATSNSSKEFTQLQRKVLERNSGPSANSMPSSYLNDVRAAINIDVPPTRAAARKAKESMTRLHGDEPAGRNEKTQTKLTGRKKKEQAAEKELKPGYCENCREKFEDFDEHVVSRKHRKFALTPSNWTELDELLGKLARPIKITA